MKLYEGGFIMIEIEKLDDKLYRAMYGLPKVGDASIIWEQIKSKPEILREAVKIKRNKWDNGDLVNGLTICSAMLTDYCNVDQVAYNELIQNIYTNTDIARIVINGASNGGYSYLLMSLWNDKIKLAKKQKAFAVNEAMNKIGTIRYENNMNNYSKKLDEKRITDKQTMYTEFGGSMNPVGAKTGNMYLASMFTSLSMTQAHGNGDFDIRYWILKNSNCTLDEKQKLIMDFWADDEVYDETLEQWEWSIVNDNCNYKGEAISQFDKFKMYAYSYQELFHFYGNKKTTDRIWNEIQFCKQMHQLRPQQWEIEPSKSKTLVKI